MFNITPKRRNTKVYKIIFTPKSIKENETRKCVRSNN